MSTPVNNSLAAPSTAMNRLRYDQCAYSRSLEQSIAPLDYYTDISAVEHCNRCMGDVGIIGGTAVSHVSGDLVALENDLRNLTRPATKCPMYQYKPTPPGEPINTQIDMSIPGRRANPLIDTQLNHLPSCQWYHYPQVPAVPAQPPFRCITGTLRGQEYASINP